MSMSADTMVGYERDLTSLPTPLSRRDAMLCGVGIVVTACSPGLAAGSLYTCVHQHVPSKKIRAAESPGQGHSKRVAKVNLESIIGERGDSSELTVSLGLTKFT